MKLTTKYASLIDISNLTESEAETVAAFSADVMKAYLNNDQDQIKQACICLLSSFPVEVVVKIGKVIEEMSKPTEQKTANWLNHSQHPVAAPLLGAAIISTLSTVIPQVVGSALSSAGKLIDHFTDNTGAKVLESVFRAHPELAADKEQTLANYATIQKFSPTMASDANAVGHLLSNVHQLDGKLTYTTLAELSKIEQQLAQAKEKSSPSGFHGFGKSLGTAYQEAGKGVGQKAIEEGVMGHQGSRFRSMIGEVKTKP